jgi:hypothetical protein
MGRLDRWDDSQRVWSVQTDFQHMPELPTQYGYYFALASMAAVAFGLMSCFYWNGWLS